MRKPPVEQQGRIADRIAAARRGRFVGRAGELALFRAALLADEPPFVVLHLHGPGGVGKTTLLREYARIATECGRAVVRLDGRDIEPTQSAFQQAVRQALGQPTGDATSPFPPDGVLLIDTYERLGALDGWLREVFVPQLPSRSVVVCAGRDAPAPDWRTDIDWAELTRLVPLQNLRPEESQAYLATRGIPTERHATALAFTRGHPLALTLIADLFGQGTDLASIDPQGEPEVVRILLERLVRDVPSARHRLALKVCALARVTTAPLMDRVLGGDEGGQLFDWLRRLSFVEHGPHGIFPHDLAREVLDADARWRDPAAYQQLGRRIYAYLRRRIAEASGLAQQRLELEALYVMRHRDFMRAFFNWDTIGGLHSEAATPADAVPIVAMVRAHEGEASAAIARHWLERQPEAFLIFRTDDDPCFGFMAHLALHRATPEDRAVDPAVAATLAFVERYGPIAPSEEVLQLRFWMHRESYQAVTAAINLTAMNIVTQVMTRPRIAWNFIAIADPDFWFAHFTGLNWPRSPQADFAVGERQYGTFAHDWRVESAERWMVDDPLPMPFDRSRGETATPPVPPLSQADHARAVRQALRDYSRPDRLHDNPLIGSRLTGGAANRGESAIRLQALLREAVATLTTNPRDVKFHRALWHTYFEPAATQELAAELLDLPFNTYRYHLTNGIERVAEWLWRREQAAAR